MVLLLKHIKYGLCYPIEVGSSQKHDSRQLIFLRLFFFIWHLLFYEVQRGSNQGLA